MMVSDAYTLDMTPGGTPLVIPVSQYDNNTREIELTLYANGAPYSVPSGSIVTVQGTKPDGTGYQYSCPYVGAVVTMTVLLQMTIYSGRQEAELVITNSDDVIGSANFVLAVEPATLRDDTVISDTELSLLQQMPVYASDAEAWAAGTRSGVPVTSDDPAYHNNGAYYLSETEDAEGAATSAATTATEAAEDAETAAGNAASSERNAATSEANAATSERNAAISETNAASSERNAATSATNAATSETNAATSARNAATSETNAEAAATNASTAVSSALNGLTFGQDADGNWGYKIGGADPVIPFSSGSGGGVSVLYWTTAYSNTYVSTPTQTHLAGNASMSGDNIVFENEWSGTVYYYVIIASVYSTGTAIFEPLIAGAASSTISARGSDNAPATGSETVTISAGTLSGGALSSSGSMRYCAAFMVFVEDTE